MRSKLVFCQVVCRDKGHWDFGLRFFCPSNMELCASNLEHYLNLIATNFKGFFIGNRASTIVKLSATLMLQYFQAGRSLRMKRGCNLAMYFWRMREAPRQALGTNMLYIRVLTISVCCSHVTVCTIKDCVSPKETKA